jgi:hypothetical protein
MRHLDSFIFQREFVDNVSGLAGVIGWSTDAIVLNDEVVSHEDIKHFLQPSVNGSVAPEGVQQALVILPVAKRGKTVGQDVLIVHALEAVT